MRRKEFYPPMTNNKMHILIQVLFLGLCIMLALSIISLFLKWNTELHYITVKIKGSSVVYQEARFLFSAILCITFLFFFIKEFFYNHQRPFPDVIIAVTGACFLWSTFILEGGWTLYPPLSSLGEGGLSPDYYEMMLWGLRAIIFILLVFVLLRWLNKKGKSV